MTNLSKNLNALRAYNPDVADELKPISPGAVVIRQEFQPNQFQTQLQQLSQKQIKQVVLIGAGSGRVIQRILDIINPMRLVVIESNPELLVALFHQHDFSQPIQQRQLIFGFGTSIQTLETRLKNVKTSLAAYGYQVIVNPEVYEDTSSAIQSIVQTIQLIIEQESLFLRMRLARANLCQMNLIQNLPAVLESISMDHLLNLCDRKTALIVAAGPSLDESVDEIKQEQNRFIIIAVDTAVRSVLSHGIHPHIVVTTDPTKDNAKHFDGVTVNQNTIIAFTPDCQSHNLQIHRSHPYKICLFDDSTHLSYWMQKKLDFNTILKRPLNVSEAAVRLALHMGFETVVFSGLDLAIPTTGGKTHSSEASHSFSIRKFDEGNIQIQKQDGAEEWLPVVAVAGWDEKQVFTYPSFQMYLRELESIIDDYDINWIDCTKFGAKKQGCKRMTLLETANQYGQPKESIEHTIFQIQNMERFDSTFCIQGIKDGIEVLESHKKNLQKIATGEFGLDECVEIWSEFMQDSTVRTLLDHVVFRFQLAEPLERIESSKRLESVKQYATDACAVLTTYITIFNSIMKPLGTDP